MSSTGRPQFRFTAVWPAFNIAVNKDVPGIVGEGGGVSSCKQMFSIVVSGGVTVTEFCVKRVNPSLLHNTAAVAPGSTFRLYEPPAMEYVYKEPPKLTRAPTTGFPPEQFVTTPERTPGDGFMKKLLAAAGLLKESVRE